MNAKSALLEFRSVSKAFGSFYANQEVSFSIRKGTIHALVGENGAGKSTLMKILFGLYQKTSGETLLQGKTCNFESPIRAKASGLGMVHQHFMLAGPLCALDHILLDQREQSSWVKNIFFPLPRHKILKEIKKMSEEFNMPVPWLTTIDKLSVGIQQRIEILKLLYNRAEILILDEPTAVLTPQEVSGFFEQILDLKKAGKTIIIITHKLKEVLAIADDVTVLRQGRTVHSGPVSAHSIESLSELMIGRRLKPIQTKSSTKANFKIILEAQKLSYSDRKQKYLDNVDLHVCENEIVGLAGVEGNGQSQLLDLLVRPLQMRGVVSGQVLVNQQSSLTLTATQIRNYKMNYFPEDRLHQALLLEASAPENYLLGQQFKRKFQKNGWLNWRRIIDHTKKIFDEYDVRPKNLNLALGRFSGGNQQKFVVGRELSQNPKILIAAQPTRGVDVGAIESIHSEIFNLKNQGAAILLVSSDLDEVMKLSDRIYVMFSGKIQVEFLAKDFNENKIGAAMAGLNT